MGLSFGSWLLYVARPQILYLILVLSGRDISMTIAGVKLSPPPIRKESRGTPILNLHPEARSPVPPIASPTRLPEPPPAPMEQPPASDAADWSKLPSDILTSILCCLEFPDLFSSAIVCTSWRTTARDLLRLGRIYSHPQTPCLFYISPAGVKLYSRRPALQTAELIEPTHRGPLHLGLVSRLARHCRRPLRPPTP